jgi:hypothetical protein
MTHENKAGLHKRRLLAAGLSVVMVVLVARALITLYEEGDAMCEALYQQVEKLPGPRAPCTLTAYDDMHTALVEVRSTYDYAEGGLAHISVDRGGDGDVDFNYDCSVLGKMLMPVTNYQAWSSFGATTEMAKSGVMMEITSEKTRVHAPNQMETQANLQAHPTSGLVAIFSAQTRNEEGQLLYRVDYAPSRGVLSYKQFDYDASGDLRRVELSEMVRGQTEAHATEYTYECWD